MSNTKPARGMRDFLPADVRKRNYVINIIKEVYESYGFEPLETPSVENLDTLTNKYGEEGNQLMFKILKRGEKLQEELSKGKITNENELSDLALRYDLTVPLARVVANYKNELPKFFKRYQIQPVWRADRPARGRYREFYQCDVDAIGSSSMIVEAELCAAVSDILERLKFHKFIININHRKLLTGILDSSKIPKELHNETLVILDKVDKIGNDAVADELVKIGIIRQAMKFLGLFKALSQAKNKSFSDYFSSVEPSSFSDDNLRKIVNDLNYSTLQRLEGFITTNEDGQTGISELRNILKFSQNLSASKYLLIQPQLARGLSYYTGAIMEIQSSVFTGSIGGGGRYNGLIGMFGKEQIPAVGFSLGLERILLIMEERRMFPENLTANSADVMVTLWNEETSGESLKLADNLRKQGLRVLVYPEADKLGKQFKYADSLNIPFVCILGENEIAENKVALKNMKSGEQTKIERDKLYKEHFLS